MFKRTTVDKDRRRDELLEELSRGRLEPEAAERIAREEGLEPLRHIPGPNDFDPENEAWWTLPMVVAWIVWRTFDRVRAQSDPYRAAAPYWAKHTVRDPGNNEVISEFGYHLEHMDQAWTLGLLLHEAWDICEIQVDERETSVREALVELSLRASAAQVQGVALRQVDNIVAEIPAFEWCYLEVGESRWRDQLQYRHDKSARYYSIRIRQKEVLQCWPMIEASVQARRDARRRCLNALVELMSISPDKPTTTKGLAAEQAKKLFNIARDPFDDVWAEAAQKAGAPAWTKAGRRPNNRTGEIGLK